jgi:hypothetical protein
MLAQIHHIFSRAASRFWCINPLLELLSEAICWHKVPPKKEVPSKYISKLFELLYDKVKLILASPRPPYVEECLGPLPIKT